MARADARRNRARLLDAARAALEAEGPDASLEGIARAAGVGIATLYRNWPTRSSLVREVMADRVAALVESPRPLLAGHPAADALRRWIGQFFDLAPYLGVIIEGDPGRRLVDDLAGSLAVLLAANDGDLGGVRPRELLLGLGGVINVLGAPQDRARAEDLADLLLDGMRHRRLTASDLSAAAGMVDPPWTPTR